MVGFIDLTQVHGRYRCRVLLLVYLPTHRCLRLVDDEQYPTLLLYYHTLSVWRSLVLQPADQQPKIAKMQAVDNRYPYILVQLFLPT